MGKATGKTQIGNVMEKPTIRSEPINPPVETRRSGTSEEVKQLRSQNEGLKQALAEATLKVIKYNKWAYPLDASGPCI